MVFFGVTTQEEAQGACCQLNPGLGWWTDGIAYAPEAIRVHERSERRSLQWAELSQELEGAYSQRGSSDTRLPLLHQPATFV
jgi:hypothetical protein